VFLSPPARHAARALQCRAAGRKKTHFRGLPVRSPVARSTYYGFSQTTLYNETVISDLPGTTMVRFLIGGLLFLMIRQRAISREPTFSIKTLRAWSGLSSSSGLIFRADFPAEGFLLPVRHALRDVGDRSRRC